MKTMHYPNTIRSRLVSYLWRRLLQKYIRNKKSGLLSETHEVLHRLIKTSNINVFKMAAPTENRFPRPYSRSRIGRNGLGSETTTSILAAITKIIKNTSIRHLTIIRHTCEHSGLR